MFKKGQSGNPNGRPRGARDHRNVFLDALELAGSSEQKFADKVREMAESGNSTAMSIVAERLWKPHKQTLPPVQLPEADTKQEHAINVITALATGQVTPDQATAIMHVLRQAAELTEIQELLERIRALEEE